jgi:hypothetical protein
MWERDQASAWENTKSFLDFWTQINVDWQDFRNMKYFSANSSENLRPN